MKKYPTHQNIQILLLEPFHYAIHIADKLRHNGLKDHHQLYSQLNGQSQFSVEVTQVVAKVILKLNVHSLTIFIHLINLHETDFNI